MSLPDDDEMTQEEIEMEGYWHEKSLEEMEADDFLGSD